MEQLCLAIDGHTWLLYIAKVSKAESYFPNPHYSVSVLKLLIYLFPH